MICSICKYSKTNIVTVCGHSFHTKCLGRANRFKSSNSCPECGCELNPIDMYSDIISELGLPKFDQDKVSIREDSLLLMESLEYMLQKPEAPIKKILERTQILYCPFSELKRYTVSFINFSLINNNVTALSYFEKTKKRRLVYECDVREALKSANEKGYYEVVNRAYNHFIIKNSQSYSCLDPLSFAAKNGDYHIMERLLSSNNPLYINARFEVAILNACISDYFSSIEEKIKFLDFLFENVSKNCLIKYKRNNDRYLEGAFYRVIEKNDIKLVEFLLGKVSKPSKSVLDKVIQNGNVEILKLCRRTDNEIHPNEFYTSYQALLSASRSDSIEMVKYLIDHGILNHLKNISMLEFIEQGHFDIIELLLRSGVQPSKYNLFSKACEMGRLDLIKLLIDYGANPINPEYEECTLLIEFNFKYILSDEKAVQELFEYFLKIGVDIDYSVTNADFRPFSFDYEDVYLKDFALTDEYLGMVSELIKYGMNVNIEFSRINRLLAENYSYDCFEVLMLLIKNGAQIYDACNGFSNSYRTPFQSEDMVVKDDFKT